MIAHLVVAEVPVAPLVPAGGLAALGLLAFLGYLVATGMLKAYSETLGAFIRWLAHRIDVRVGLGRFGSVHPLRAVSHAMFAVDKQIHNAFAALALRAENAAAWCFSTAGHIFWWSVHETADLAHDVLNKFHETTVDTIPKAVRSARDDTLARLRGIDHTIGRIEAQARAQLKRLQVGIDRLGHRLEHTMSNAISAVRSRVGALERGERTARRDLARVKSKLGAAAFTAAVALALTRIMGNWIRCPSLRNIGRKVGCKGFAGIEALLALSFEVMVASDLCTITKAMQRAAREAVPAFNYLASHIPALIACQKASRPKPMKAKYFAPPPVSGLAPPFQGV